MSTRISIVLIALVACDTSGAGSGSPSGAKTAESGTKRGSAGGFSAAVTADLVKAGVIDQATATSAAAGAEAPAATATAVAKATPSPPTPAAAPAPAAAPTAAPAAAPTAAPAAAPTAAPAAAAAPAATPTKTSTKARTYVKPTGELASVKFDLEPNWERDMGEAGTFSLLVKIPPTEDTRVFSVRYGIEDQAAPVDCDQYRKFLEDKKVMTVTLNRQRGGACYLEGADGSGAVYRYLLVYGGRRLFCQGSLYKDVANLGDLRDKVLMQAKKICETLAL